MRRGLGLTLGQTAVVPMVLKIGAIQEQVVITESVPLVETTRSGVTALVDQQQIRDLPLNGRDFSQLTLLQPGVLATPTTERSLDRGMGTQFSVAGARPNQISYLLDGTDVNTQGNQSPGSAAGGLLGVETVREFQVLVNSYSAEYGRSAGGIVSAVTRSGTNTLHGAGFEFLRDDALDREDVFDPVATRRNRRSRATSSAAISAARSGRTGRSSSAATKGCGRIRPRRRSSACRAGRRARAPTSARRSHRTWRCIRCRTARKPARPASIRTRWSSRSRENYFVARSITPSRKTTRVVGALP